MIFHIKWLSLLDKVNSVCHKPITVSPMVTLRNLNLSQELFQVKFKTGVKSTLDAKFRHMTQRITSWFLIMEENTPIKLLFLPQVSNTELILLKD